MALSKDVVGPENECWTSYIEEEFSIRHLATDVEKVQVNPGDRCGAGFKMPAKAE